MALTIEDCGHYSKALLDTSFDLLLCHTHNPDRYPFLLESHRHVNENSRFDILFAFPGDEVRADNLSETNFFSVLDRQFKKHFKPSTSDECLPFTGGWFIYLSYEVAGLIEPTLASINEHPALPLAVATKIPVAIIKDHLKKRCWLVCEKGQEALLHLAYEDIGRVEDNDIAIADFSNSTVTTENEGFISSVENIHDYIKEGDTFQVNLSKAWSVKLDDQTSPIDIYRSFRATNPSPFAGLAKIDDHYICSTSPERLVKTNGDKIHMRPIAGTRPRSADKQHDRQLANELLENTKEAAEHIMLIDLIRNDLGRVCNAGTIVVDEHMTIESYATVHHIVSNVGGRFDVGRVTPSDIIKAVFPGGTITGCPKVRCMEIINELEDEPRGAYTGSMGYINYNGNMDLNILIRTAVMHQQSLVFRTGAGIVADSIATSELKETEHKAKGMLNALGVHSD